jgi:hypothetical protein
MPYNVHQRKNRRVPMFGLIQRCRNFVHMKVFRAEVMKPTFYCMDKFVRGYIIIIIIIIIIVVFVVCETYYLNTILYISQIFSFFLYKIVDC